MSSTRLRALSGTALLLSGVACSGATRTSHPAPSPETARTPGAGMDTAALPPVPLVEGPLRPRVVYPTGNALIQSRDSNFILGSVGHGRATLTINGVPVPVHPNGAFLAFLPLPPASAPRYDLVVALGTDTVRASHPVRLLPPRPPLEDTTRLRVDSASVEPRGALALRDGEMVRVSVRANRPAVLVGSGGRVPLVAGGAAGAPEDRFTWATDVPARLLRAPATLLVAGGADTVRLALPAVAPADSAAPRWALAVNEDGAGSDTDRVVIARPTPAGTYKWLLLPGTPLQVTGRVGGSVRVRLDSQLEAWIDSAAVRLLPAGTAAPRRVVGAVQVTPAPEWVDVIVPTGARPAFLVQEAGTTLELTLHGTQLSPGLMRLGGLDSLLRMITWEQVATDRARMTLHLSAAPFGYLALWDSTRSALVLRVRRPPRVARRAPLRGLVIAVDAGHPPIGATGPTGLWEPQATLPVAQRLERLLQLRGATVVMTRTTDEPVALGDRPVIARRAGAHAFVSIHYNALPDGVNPFVANGTSTLFFHPHSEPLARAVQRGMLDRLRLRDIGIHYQNLATARATWMPAILCEGAFMMLPEQEAAMRDPEFQEAYARGIADGLEAYFRALESAQ